MLAGSTVDNLRSKVSDDPDSPPIVCYYFFRQDATRKVSRVEAYRAIVTQLFQQTHKVKRIDSVFSMADQKSDSLPLAARSKASELELLDTLRLCLHLINTYFVVDGIDECSDADTLVQNLSELCRHTQLKVILFSRPNLASLRRSVSRERCVVLEREALDEDIAQYLDLELSDLLTAGLIPKTIEIDSLKERFLRRAEGMFLWVRLMVAYLKSPALTRAQRIDAMMESTPEGLDVMYRRIIRRIQGLDQPSRDLACRALMWIAYGGSPFNALELKEGVFSNTWDNDEKDGAENFGFALVVSCCGLVEKWSNGRYYFIHLTAEIFLLSTSCTAGNCDIMVPNRVDGTLRIMTSCLSYILYSVSLRPLSGQLKLRASTEDISARLPFLSYSSSQWILHWYNIADQVFEDESDGEMLTKFARQLTTFLRARTVIMVWIEAIFTFGGNPCFAKLLALAENLSKYSNKFTALNLKQVHADFLAFASDMSELSLSWADTLETHPEEI